MLMVSPSRPRTMIEVRIESGIEMAMMMVRAPAAEEEQDHEAGERGGDDGFADDAR